MTQWKIPVTWQVCGFVEIEADTLKQAMEIARDDEGEIPCPTENDYVDGSWELSMDNEEEIRSAYNDNPKDEGE